MTIYCQKHDNILISREKNALIFEKLEGCPNLSWAEFLPPWAFLDSFCKVSTPVAANWNLHSVVKSPSIAVKSNTRISFDISLGHKGSLMRAH